MRVTEEMAELRNLVRALLERERVGLQDVWRRGNLHQRERIIDIKKPVQSHSARATTLSTRQHANMQYTSPINLRRTPIPSSGPSRVSPISAAKRAHHQSPASRRDMVSFTKARSADCTTATTPMIEKQADKTGNRIQPFQKSVNLKVDSKESQDLSTQKKPLRAASPPKMHLIEREKQVFHESKEGNGKEESKDKGTDVCAGGPAEKKILDSVSIEEIIEKVIRPAGFEAKVCSSGDSKVRYHVEKSEQEDGTLKTQIVLESKVEEELDVGEHSDLEDLLSHNVKRVSLEEIEETATGSMIKNLLSSLQGGENLEKKSVNVEIIEEPMDSYSDEELQLERESRSSFYEPSTYFQIEEMENVSFDHQHGGRGDVDNPYQRGTDQFQGGSVQVQEASQDSGSPHEQDFHEYFVSTPDEIFPELEEGLGITSSGHYGIVDDLSDEKYYQDESLPQRRVIVGESDENKHVSGDRLSVKENFPECIIEEEVRVSPVVQESFLGFLKEESLAPQEQLKGALEKLQSSVSGPLREELAFLTKVSSESPHNVAVRKVEQSSNNGTMTIVAELNVSQTLEDSGLLEERHDVSEEQIMKALKSNPELEKALHGAGAGYSVRVSTEEVDLHSGDFDGFGPLGESASQIIVEQVKVESEKPFSFPMESEGGDEVSSEHSKDQKVATVYLDCPLED